MEQAGGLGDHRGQDMVSGLRISEIIPLGAGVVDGSVCKVWRWSWRWSWR